MFGFKNAKSFFSFNTNKQKPPPTHTYTLFLIAQRVSSLPLCTTLKKKLLCFFRPLNNQNKKKVRIKKINSQHTKCYIKFQPRKNKADFFFRFCGSFGFPRTLAVHSKFIFSVKLKKKKRREKTKNIFASERPKEKKQVRQKTKHTPTLHARAKQEERRTNPRFCFFFRMIFPAQKKKNETSFFFLFKEFATHTPRQKNSHTSH